MTIFGTFAENTRFRGAMDATLAHVDPSLGATQVRAALDSANLSNLSTQEKNVLMSLADTLAADGYLSGSDAQAITGMISKFESSGRFFDTLTGGNRGKLEVPDAHADFLLAPTPMPVTNMRYVPTPLFGGLLGFFVERIVQTFKDMLFQGAAQGMLGTCDGCANQQKVSAALYGADLSKLSPTERSTVMAMIGFASADGHVSRVESKAIINYLNRAQGIVPPANPDWSVQQNGGTAHIDLGNYTLDLNEGSSEFVLTNKATGEKTRIWGDPHVEVDGKAVGDFYGTMTLNLDDGTKITINTTPYSAGNGMTLSSRLTITQGDRAMIVSGLDQNKLGDLKIDQVPVGGQVIDAIQGDGVDIYENPEGAGWLQLNASGLLQAVDADFLRHIR